jgi:hypothetical protein
MSVQPADEVRRRTVGARDLDDLPVTLLVALVASPDRQLIARLCTHADLLIENHDGISVNRVVGDGQSRKAYPAGPSG